MIVACSKFGWNHFLIAYLLPRVDPNRPRSRAVFWFCIAAGLANVMYASMLLGVILFLIMGLLGAGGFQAVVVQGFSAFGMLFLCYLLMTVAVSRGVYLANQSQTKIWLGGTSQENLAGASVESCQLLCLLSLFVFLLCGGILNPQGILLVVFNVYVWLFIIGFTGFIVLMNVTVGKRYLAATPFECWDLDDLGNLMVAKISSSRRAKLLMQLKQEKLVQPEPG